MSRSVRRHSGNYAAVVLLVFGAVLGLDWLLIQLGLPPIAGCTLQPFLYLILGTSAGVWMMTAGVLLCLFGPTRAAGTTLLLGGMIIGVLPQLLEHYLTPLCRIR